MCYPRHSAVVGLRSLLLPLALLLLLSPTAYGEYFDISIAPQPGEKFKAADYHLWMPDGVKRVRGIVIRQHGCGDPAVSTGLSNANDLQWQTLAAKHGCALLGPRLTTHKACEDWANPDNGTASALPRALDGLAVTTAHPEVKTVPWVLSGHSGGAFWTASMVFKYPQRIAAAVPMRGTLPAVGADAMNTLFMHAFPADPAAPIAAVPVLWASGAKDTLINKKSDPRELFARSPQALWTLAVDPNAGHELANLRALELPYLDAMMSRRLSDDSDTPRPLDTANAFLGDIFTRQIFPADKFPGDKTKAAWLPDEKFARLWQLHVKTGAIHPTAAPAAPSGVVALRSGSDVEITWNWPIAIDAPMPAFRILRDGQPIGTHNPQGHGYSDEPAPVQYAMKFRDTKPAAGQGASYQVTAFYQPPQIAGGMLESTASAAATITGITPNPGPLPDLVLTDLTMTPPDATDGKAITLVATITNRGEVAVPAGKWISAILRVNKGVTWAHVAGPLEPGKSVVLTCVHTVPFTADAGVGSATVRVDVDELGRIRESDEGNNATVRVVKLQGSAAGR